MPRILLVGGGTGGHVFPLMAVADALREKTGQNGIDLELMVLGEGRFMREACVERDLKFKPILAGKLRRYFSFLIPLDILKIPVGFLQSLWHLFWFMPDLVFAKGGFASFSPALAAKIYFIPVFCHESDAVPGLTNSIIGRMASVVFISFQSAAKYFKDGKTILVGNPIRKDLFSGDRSAASIDFPFDQSKKTVLVLGGSQGAKTINDLIVGSLIMLLAKYNLIHQCGETQYEAVKKDIDELNKEESNTKLISDGYRLHPFFNAQDLAKVYALTDVIISRAGAANIFEIAALGKPAIIVPITNSAGNHQIKNAQEFSQYGAIMMEEANLTPHLLINQIDSLIENSAEIGQKIKTFAKPDAADKIAGYLIS